MQRPASMWTGRLVASIVVPMIGAFALAPSITQAEATRKPGRHSQPASTSRTAPDTTGTIPVARKPKPAAPSPIVASRSDDEPLQAPYKLPQASRERMRACGLRWQQMKMSGETGDEVWRDYATKCLASKDGPEASGSDLAGSDPAKDASSHATRAP